MATQSEIDAAVRLQQQVEEMDAAQKAKKAEELLSNALPVQPLLIAVDTPLPPPPSTPA